MSDETDVLIVGGSLVGLSAAVFLAHQGVRCRVVERHASTSIHPRARGFTARTMELYHAVGLGRLVEAAGTVDEQLGLMATARQLADDEWMSTGKTAEGTAPGVSPYRLYACDQDRLEPLLVTRAQDLGASLSFGSELTGFAQDASGVTSTVTDRRRGTTTEIRSRYLLAADGVNSRIRGWLGISNHGPGSFGHKMNILFSADLTPAVRGRQFFAATLHSVAGGTIVRRDEDRWQASVEYHPERGESPADFTESRSRALVERLTGLPGLKMKILNTLPWEVTAQVADRYRAERVFLVGDAAHTTTPWGGLGGNTGIQDVHNIAWKLADVLNGKADQTLLDSYEAERQPVAELTVRYAMARMRGQTLTTDYTTISLGYCYHAGALLPEPPLDEELLEDPRHPSGRPGTRAPHIELNDAGGASTLDWFGSDWVLLTGPDGDSWAHAVTSLGPDVDARVMSRRIGPPDQSEQVVQRWSAAYGVAADGAVLVRPDGFIAWRSPNAAADSFGVLDQVLRTLQYGPALNSR